MSRILEALQSAEVSREDGTDPPGLEPGRIRLTVKQRVAIRALLRTPTVEEAAIAAGVTERTLRRWLGRPGFVAEYYATGRVEIETAAARVEVATKSALAALGEARDLLQAVRDRATRRTKDSPTADDVVDADR